MNIRTFSNLLGMMTRRPCVTACTWQGNKPILAPEFKVVAIFFYLSYQPALPLIKIL